jgi:hypothetical protein
MSDLSAAGRCPDSTSLLASSTSRPATLATGGLEGLVVDTCGNVYVADFGPGLIWRIDGENDRVYEADLGVGGIELPHLP